MSLELYFLRSSENKIVEDMVKYTHLNEKDFEKFTKLYGLTTKDLGLYALKNNKITGALWSREFDGTPIINLAVLPEYRGEKIASKMMEQYLLEAAALYDRVEILTNSETRGFFEKFGFSQSEKENILEKKLERKEVARPSDGYDPSKWLD